MLSSIFGSLFPSSSTASSRMSKNSLTDNARQKRRRSVYFAEQSSQEDEDSVHRIKPSTPFPVKTTPPSLKTREANDTSKPLRPPKKRRNKKLHVAKALLNNRNHNFSPIESSVAFSGIATEKGLNDIKNGEATKSNASGMRHYHPEHTENSCGNNKKSSQISRDYDTTEPDSMEPDIQTKTLSFLHANDVKKPLGNGSPSKISPNSPITFDDIQRSSRDARSWGLSRPEDLERVPVDQRRRKIFRLASSTLWLRSLNHAIIERDYKRVHQLLDDETHGIRTSEQFDKLIRCCVVLRDWKSLAILLSRGKFLVSEREVIDASRDAVAYGLSSSSSSDLSQQQICMHMLMCNINRSNEPTAKDNMATMKYDLRDLMRFCRQDDIVSLACGFLHCQDTLGLSPTDFCNQETKVHIPASRFVEERRIGENPDQDQELRERIADSYFTPEPRFHGCNNSNEQDDDEELFEFYRDELVPLAINCRWATLLEFSAMISAPHCLTFLTELASCRLQ